MILTFVFVLDFVLFWILNSSRCPAVLNQGIVKAIGETFGWANLMGVSAIAAVVCGVVTLREFFPG